MIRLRPKDIEKIATILQIPQFAVEKMAGMNLIQENHAVDLLIVNDWKRMKRNNRNRYPLKFLIKALEREYQVSDTKVEAAIYNKRKSIYICRECGKRITKTESVRNDGVCDDCVIDSIEV